MFASKLLNLNGALFVVLTACSSGSGGVANGPDGGGGLGATGGSSGSGAAGGLSGNAGWAGAGAAAGNGATGGSGGVTADAGCTVPSPGAVDGAYLLAVSAAIAPKKPLVFATNVTTQPGPSGLEMTWEMTPLSAADRQTPVGPAIAKTFPISSGGVFDFDLTAFSVPGAANPISGSDLSANLTTVRGTVCDADGFYCGDVEGMITAPVQLDLNGSTFALERTGSAGNPEPPKLNCLQELAEPIGP